MIKSFKYCEQMHRAYRKKSNILQPQFSSGLSCVDIPDPRASSEYGDPRNYKQWHSIQNSLTDPEEIARAVNKVNIAQNHQAHEAAFGAAPLTKLFGQTDLLSETLLQPLLTHYQKPPILYRYQPPPLQSLLMRRLSQSQKRTSLQHTVTEARYFLISIQAPCGSTLGNIIRPLPGATPLHDDVSTFLT